MKSDLIKKEMALVENEIIEIIPKEPKEVYGMLPAFIRSGGKRIRPLLTLLCCKAAGGDPKKAIRIAAIIELFHNFTLLHDDIEDDSTVRRGEPALHITHGVPIALNSGDALYTIIWEALQKVGLPPQKLLKLQAYCSDAFKAVVEGQGMELYWHKNNVYELSEKDYLDMAKGKTSSLLALACVAGAYTTTENKKTINALREFGNNLGMAFQIQDDILNVTGTLEKYKKEIGGDIKEGKRTLLVINAIKKATSDEKKRMKEILCSRNANNEEVAYVISLFKKYGAIEETRKIAEKTIAQAKLALKNIKNSEAKKALLEVLDFVVNREQ